MLGEWGGHGEVGLGLGVCTGCGGAGWGGGGECEVGGLQSVVWVVMVRFGLCSRRVDGRDMYGLRLHSRCNVGGSSQANHLMRNSAMDDSIGGS